MKKLLVTAAALTLGTSAFAWAPAEKAHMDAMGVEAAQADWSKSAWNAEKSPLAFSSLEAKTAKTDSAGLTASASTISGDVPAMFAKWQDPSVEPTATASLDMGDVKGAVYAASLEEEAVVQTASSDGKASGSASQHVGMGGPAEEPQGYPACTPGRGDDNCIQLYERGVVNALAAWKGTEPAVAVGGPYEPATTSGAKDHSAHSTDHAAMGHDQTAATSHGSATSTDSGKPATLTATEEGMSKLGDSDATAGTSPGATGGPIEPVTAYPPCRPGRGDDRCIQLYERGVARRD